MKSAIEQMNSYIEKVRELGEAIGYSQIMDLSSALWRMKLREAGISETSAFIPILQSDVKESEISFYLNKLKNREEYLKTLSIKDKTTSLPEYILNQPKKVLLNGDEYEEIFMKFEDKAPQHKYTSLNIIHSVYIDDDGIKYHFYYQISNPNQPLIEKEIDG